MAGCRTLANVMGYLLLGMLGAVSAAGQHKSATGQKSDALDEKNWMQQCKAGEPGLSDLQCGLWVSRKEFVHKAKCSEQDASVGCGSFQELIKDDDADLMLDLARQDHVYACFRPGQDVFMEIYFSDPNDGAGRGVAEVRYYKDGIASDGSSFHNDGTWTRGLTALSGDPLFSGENIRIEGSRFEASQMYKNESKLDIHHTIVLQLSTGRFTEKFAEQPSGETVDEYSGRCFVLPTAAH
jgi:hypothetical protein